MKALFVFIEMIFCHCFADYFLQGILASMKQKKWWAKQAPNISEFEKSKYINDYKAALIAHSIEWTFVVQIPLFIFVVQSYYAFAEGLMYLLLFIYNAIAHYVIDDYKANKHKINLIQDQRLHLIQILLSWIMWWAIVGIY